MSDPYRPAYYTPPSATAGSPYNPQDYSNTDSYGQLTTHHRPSHSGSSGYYPQSQTQLTHPRRSSYDDDDDDSYLSPPTHRTHRSKSRSSHHRHSRHHSPSDRDRDRSRDRSSSHSRLKEAGATAAGGAAGALIGHKIGHGNIGTIAGLAVGALGARALEQQFEKRGEKKRLEREFDGAVDRVEGRDRDRDDYGRRSSGGGRPGTRERRKSFVEQAQEKVSGFLGVGGDDKRRSRSHVGTRGRGYDDSDSEGSEVYERRGGRSHGGRRDDW